MGSVKPYLPGWGHGVERISREALASLTRVRAEALRAVRHFFEELGVMEVTSSTLTQMSGSCENPATMFSLPYYGRTAYLAQSAQLQLEVIVAALNEPVYTLTTSYRAEDYMLDEDSRRRLSEFTLIEVEAPGWSLETLMRVQEELLAAVVRRTLAYARREIESLGGKPEELAALRPPFPRIEYADAVRALIQEGLKPPAEASDGWDFGMREERVLIGLHGDTPAFLVHHPSGIKYFNMQRRAGAAMSVDLLTPPIGETSGGGERESDPDLTARQLHESRMLEKIRLQGGSEDEFSWYLQLLRDPGLPPRAGFGLGFERMIAFLLGTDDIVSCLEFPSTDAHLFP